MKSGIKLQITTAGLDDLEKNFPGRADAVDEKVAGDIVAYIHDHFSTTSPQPSAAGEPPAVQTGTLKKSVTFERTKKRYYRVLVTAPYAKYLEYGTRKMQARPFMRPAVLAIAGKLPSLMKAAVAPARGIGGGGLRTIVMG